MKLYRGYAALLALVLIACLVFSLAYPGSYQDPSPSASHSEGSSAIPVSDEQRAQGLACAMRSVCEDFADSGLCAALFPEDCADFTVSNLPDTSEGTEGRALESVEASNFSEEKSFNSTSSGERQEGERIIRKNKRICHKTGGKRYCFAAKITLRLYPCGNGTCLEVLSLLVECSPTYASRWCELIPSGCEYSEYPTPCRPWVILPEQNGWSCVIMQHAEGDIRVCTNRDEIRCITQNGVTRCDGWDSDGYYREVPVPEDFPTALR